MPGEDGRLPGLVGEDLIAEAIAAKVVAIVRRELAREAADEEWIDCKEVARRFGLSRSWVYDHAGLLGARRIGTGSRPRLRFVPSVVVDALRAQSVLVERERDRPAAGEPPIHVPQVRSKS
jgi:hypothetical protein